MSSTETVTATGTFPPDILPTRSGVYGAREIDPVTLAPSGEWGFAYFDLTDRVWGCNQGDIESAAQHPEYEFASQTKEWYGLTEEVKP